MKNMLIVMMLAASSAAGPAAAELPSPESLRQGCGFDGSTCHPHDEPVVTAGGETDRYIWSEIDKTSGVSGELLKEVRKGEMRLLQRALDESPTLSKTGS